jgi:hypothetical protein
MRRTTVIHLSMLSNIYSHFRELNHEEKLTQILNPSTPEKIRTVMSFIRQSLELKYHLFYFILLMHTSNPFEF